MFVFRNRIAFQAYTLLYVISIGITLLLFRSTVDNLRKNESLLTLLITANTFILFPIFMSSDLGRWIVLFCLHSFVLLAYLSVSERRQEPINLLILAAVIVTSALVYIQHWAKNLRSFSDIIQSRLSEAWGDGLSYFVSLLKTISDTI
jgi:hypothetical protein